MKILHISKFFPPIYGGIENQVKSICDYVFFKNSEVEVLAFGKKTNIRRNKYKIFEFKPFLKIFSQPLSISYILCGRKLINKSGIVHYHYPNIVGLILCFLYVKNKNLYFHWHSDILNQHYLNFFFSFIEKNLLKKSKKIIFTSSYYAKKFKYYHLFKNKIKIINCGSDNLNLQFKRNISARKNYFKIKEKFKSNKIIYSIGRLVPYKGFKYLILSSKFLQNNYKIIIAGNGGDYNYLKQLIDENNLNKKVFLLGKVSHSEHLSYLKLCDVFCLPSISKNEAFGIALIEAMSFAKPLISTKIEGSGVNFVNKNNITGLKAPIKNPKKLSNLINKKKKKKKIYKKFSLNSKKRYQQYFTSNLMNKNFYRMYKSDYEYIKCK